MKFIFAIVLFAIVSCNNNAIKKETQRMPGAYTMLSQSVNNGKKDTTYTTLKQLKIYTGNYMMYGNMNPADSVSGFGVGTYSADTGTVTENVIYSASDTSLSAIPRIFILKIEKTPNGYKQVIPEIESRGQKLRLTEAYELAGDTVTSLLDGAWKQIKAYSIKGKDTTANKAVQYKIYYDGHFIWGHTFTDSTNKLHTGIGFGTFAMNGANKLKENVAVSTYYQARGKSFDLDIEMNGADEFKQTITGADGNKGVEVYQRL